MQNTGVTLYSKPRCTGCDNTKRAFKSAGIEYTLVDITKDETAFKHVTETLGYTQAPVVETENNHWSGFRPDLIAGILA